MPGIVVQAPLLWCTAFCEVWLLVDFPPIFFFRVRCFFLPASKGFCVKAGVVKKTKAMAKAK